MGTNSSFHNHTDNMALTSAAAAQASRKLNTVAERTLQYDFDAHYHPYAGELMRRLLTGSVRGLQEADTEQPELRRELFTGTAYDPSGLVDTRPVADLDFRTRGAYAVYNWELFYHVPLAVAIHLSRSQRYAEAQRWLHFIFDPTDDSDGPSPERFWQVKPLRTTDVKLIEEILVNLATAADPVLWADTVDSIGRWKNAPFRPYLVARYRPTAYMFKAVMAYLDNLIAWGDSLFRQDSGEAINEATQLYVLAANLLGPRPQEAPRKGFSPPQTYESLRASLDKFGNAVRGIEVEIPFDVTPHPPAASPGQQLASLRGIGATLYFCIPRNDRLIGYWDTVADRLFKIRNSLNIQGVFRQLPLFDPPIDPALLARATAAGLDVGAVVAGLNQPLPLVRYALLAQKATEICQEVKSLGAGLLSALEKHDGERLALLRAQHERTVLELTETVRYHQWQEAIKAREGLERSLDGVMSRYVYYEKLLGKSDADISVPEMDELDAEAMAGANYRQGEPEIGADRLRSLDPDIAPDLGDADGRLLNRKELEELGKLAKARTYQIISSGLEATAAVLAALPAFEAAAKPFGAGAAVKYGGPQLGMAAKLGGDVVKIFGDQWTYEAGKAGKLGGYQRRELDWSYQSNLAALEMNQTFKQLRAAQIREAIAEKEYHNHRQQVRNARDIEAFLTDDRKGKRTNTELYAWLKREVRELYNRSFELAFDVARKAERALGRELGDPSQTFLQFGYRAGREGLLAGEQLFLDLKRMELAYHELNHREYELTKHVSLRQLDPLALLALRTAGRATITLPEGLFDQDGPGHYFRRIKSVAVTIPCVVGPYAGVSCTLTLLKSSIRTSPRLGDAGYARDGEDSERFSDHFGSLDAIVTSTGQNDTGLFETNLHDERYLPFEGAGAISQWQLELPLDVPQFDPDTIADVILHVRYTAREAGAALRKAAVADLRAAVQEATAAGSVRLLSVRHDFPTEWALFTGTPVPNGSLARLTLPLGPEHYPYWMSTVAAPKLLKVDLIAQPPASAISAGPPISVYPANDPNGSADVLTVDPTLALDPTKPTWRRGTVTVAEPVPTIGEFTRYLSATSMRDLWLVLTWGEAPA